jgi:hypothetical protein
MEELEGGTLLEGGSRRLQSLDRLHSNSAGVDFMKKKILLVTVFVVPVAIADILGSKAFHAMKMLARRRWDGR